MYSFLMEQRQRVWRLASSALVAGSSPGRAALGFFVFVLAFLSFVLWDCHIFFMISFTCLSQLLCSGFLTFDECFLRFGVSATRTSMTFDLHLWFVFITVCDHTWSRSNKQVLPGQPATRLLITYGYQTSCETSCEISQGTTQNAGARQCR